MNASEIALLLQRFGVALEKLNPTEIKLLLTDMASMEIVVSPSPDNKQISTAKAVTVDIDVTAIANELGSSVSREDGVMLLENLTKQQLLAVAKHISLAVDSSLTKARLIEKIVERRVGLRLRQDAFAQAMHAH